jgi:tetratricopeptide (TPR) repeat protein
VRWVVVALGVSLATSGTAWADQADDLILAGQQLATAGKFDDAIAAFHAADALRPSALHDCLIGLAELRAGRLDAAEREFAACRSRATASDPVPEWLPAEEQKLADQRVAAQPKPVPTTPKRARRSRVPTLLIAGGAGLAVAGAAIHLAIVRPARADLAAAATGADYDDHYGRYNAARLATVGLYALGGVAVAIGLVTYRRGNEVTVVGARPVDGGGLVTLEWRR